MPRLALLFGTLLLAFLIAVAALRTPAPAPADAPAHAFSAGRAMTDVRAIAQRPHPVGSADHARVADYLLARMTALDLQPTVQRAALSPGAIRRLRRWGGDPEAAGHQVANLVGVLPGRDPSARAVLLMAHYDSAWASPGAADDAAGVAAVLETVRALQARGATASRRPLVVLLTDGEELDLDGARAFFSEHPLRDRIGAVINLEARGGGGRAMMFETGRGGGDTVALFGRMAPTVAGGVSANSLAAVAYEAMPNSTDFTVPRNRGVQGVNLAFIGRPAQYHAASSTPGALDPGSVQHIGGQTLAMTETLLQAPALPRAGADAVYADLFGRFVVRHAPSTGWWLLGAAFALTGFAAWGARHATGLRLADLARGVLSGLWFLAAGLVLAQAMRALAGPFGSRAASPDIYYALLRRLPWMEAGVGLALLAAALVVLSGRGAAGRRALAGVLAAAALLTLALGGFSLFALGVGAAAAGLSLVKAPGVGSRWGGWLGLILLALALGLVVQIAVPTAAHLFIWPGLLAAAAAAVTAAWSARLARPVVLVPAAVAAALGCAWLLGLAHPTFLGVGMDWPGAMAVIGLLAVMLLRPLAPEPRHGRAVAATAAALMILAVGLSLGARFAQPLADQPRAVEPQPPSAQTVL